MQLFLVTHEATEAEIVKQVTQGFVEIGTILIRAVNKNGFAEPVSDRGPKGVKISDNGRRPEPESGEMIGASIGGKQVRGFGAEFLQCFVPLKRCISHKDGGLFIH